MTNIDKDTANWRLFGGGGLLVGGLLWTIGVVLQMASAGGADLLKWLGIIAYIVIAVGLALVAWGQTGSNGAVGNDKLGKVALFAAALGFLLLALVGIVPSLGGTVMTWITAILIVLGLIVAAVRIQQKGVARGLGVWALFLVALLALLHFLGALDLVLALKETWVGLVLGISVLLTGLLYLLNKK